MPASRAWRSTMALKRSRLDLQGRGPCLRLCGKWQNEQEAPLEHPTTVCSNKHGLHRPVSWSRDPRDNGGSLVATSSASLHGGGASSMAAAQL